MYQNLTKDEILSKLRDPDSSDLFAEADRVRKQYCGDEVHLRAIIEFSNYCKRDCLYCGLRKSNGKLTRYRMTVDEIFCAARNAQSLGYQTIVLQSGEDDGFSTDELCGLVRKIKKELDLAITLSVGEKTYEEYRAMKEAGADRYLLKIETTNPELFKKLKPDSDLEKRSQCLENLKNLGFQVGSGVMVGLPGQTLEDLTDDICFFRESDFDMIGIGPFIPHPETPLNQAKKGELNLVLKVVALTRLATLNAHLPATTAIGTIDPAGRQKALMCGANIMMPNATPKQYRRFYEIYPNKICITENPNDCNSCIQNMLRSLGRKLGAGYGHSLKRSMVKKG
ncbi:MAG: [FeFe] hydrogenase H-cluster radical SAM maturase HydE [Omnitrophica bacterium RIFCSPLOWO2_12_FULL_44_17]|uniref:[FeFe] hydrogenase H-cluster radical SAM maturase HydE n=1 Tax=Candidatus Danuiimicrobium aquiferis TaxID=1801832 RepID=A0A1G1L321_9BACT|nr:MAG: [FeFe] hydrogenase H-cluster radical SAM maturase HydE [Omnitrophica bacterium RIFCSPHIGHO2_02_FULL_45_28]OGW99528.1 MAG: [FeFe] hydrogenase H-cluster radical SAM maturase HydE [Omnitrophica bacterium RIFCSPLOWO2_12_FULL_44_17]OGX02700.1 MAG: [FeFe] hydrogenase H-cluster radical SAM maturase HydE [Omnitrophica bacterium RIFCSPLOWO2_02_FULL_44_11]